MSNQIKTIQRFFRKLRFSIMHTVPNDGPLEIDLSNLRAREPQKKILEEPTELRSLEKPSDLPNTTKT
jgi:hypothetical protein